MSDPREVGRVRCPEIPLIVSTHDGCVILGYPGVEWRLGPDEAEAFARLFVCACWQAGGGHD